MSIDRNEFLRGALASGAASFAHASTGENARVESVTLQALAHIQRLVDAASDRLRTALVDLGEMDPAVLAALQSIRGRARAIAEQVDDTLPLG